MQNLLFQHSEQQNALMTFFSIPILATAIAIMISWALFAILCSLINEAFTSIKAERGRFMRSYLFRQLQDLPNGINWASLLYMHGPVDLLSRSMNKPTSSISPRLFAESIIEVVGNAHIVQTKVKELNIEKYSQTGLNQNSPDNLLKDINEGKYNNSVANFKLATQLLKQSDVVSFFKQAATNAELKAFNSETGSLDYAQAYQSLLNNLEEWYKEFMDRLNVWYKKKIRLHLFVIGLVIGLIINIDSVQLFQFFNTSPLAREAVITFYQANATALSALANRVDSANNHTLPPIAVDSLLKVSKAYVYQIDSLKRSTDLPIGFHYNIFHSFNNHGYYSLLLKLLGVFISGFAASFGGPFWFEVLRKMYSKK